MALTQTTTNDDILQLLRSKAGLLPEQQKRPPPDNGKTLMRSSMSRLGDLGMATALAEWEKDEAQRQLQLVATGQLDPSELGHLSREPSEEKPLYAFILHAFDEHVQAAVKLQRAFRRLKKQCKDVGWPSSENPYHWIHFVDVRKQTGWSKEELYDEFGEPRERTDGGRAPRRKKEAKGTDLTAHARYMDAIGNFKERNAGRMPLGGDEQYLQMLQQTGGKVDLSLIGSYLAKRWWALRQAKLAHKLDTNPLKAEFKEGSVQYNELKKWMLGNGHGCMMLMHNPLVRDLKASLNFVPQDNQAKIMGLLGQFNNVLQYKQGGKKMRMNRHIVGMYEWVIQDVAKEYRNELEEARRWAVTPPEPPEGLDEEMIFMYDDVMKSLSGSTYRLCRLRKFGRKWLQAFEDSTWKRRRIIRTRSAGNLGLLGPSHIDPSKTTTIMPVVGEHPIAVSKWTGAEIKERPHILHIQLQYTVEKQAKRVERGRILRPLKCLNTTWMGGVDWETIEAKALGWPLPGGVRAPPPPSDDELGDLMEDVFEGSEVDSNAESDEEGETDKEEGDEETEEKAEEEQGQCYERVGSRLNKEKVKKTKVPKYKQIPFDCDGYVDEVQDIMHEMNFTGLHCRDLLDRMMIGVCAPTLIPNLDATMVAEGCDAALRTLPVAHENKLKRMAKREFGAEVTMYNEHAVVGSLGHAEVLKEVAEEQGVTVPRRPLSATLPSQLGRAVDRAYANPHLLPSLDSDSESEEEINELEYRRDGTSVRGNSRGAPSIMSRNTMAKGPGMAKSVAGRSSTDKLSALPNFGRPGAKIPGGRAPSIAGTRAAPSVAGTRRPATIAEEEEESEEGRKKRKARDKHKSTLGERLKKPEISWEMLKQAWYQGGLPGIQGQDGRNLMPQMERGSWLGHNIRKSPEELATISKDVKDKAKQSFPSGAVPPELEYYPSGLAAAKEMAVKKNKLIMAKIRENELKRRQAAGIRVDNTQSIYAGFLGKKKDDTPTKQPDMPAIAEGEGEDEENRDTAEAAPQEAPDEDTEAKQEGDDDFVEPPPPRVYEPPKSDMLVLYRNEWLSTVLADATVMQEMSQKTITERLKGRNKWTASEIPVRERRRQDELKLLEAYVDRFHTIHHLARAHPIWVGQAEMTETTPEEKRHMHQDWYALFRSEMFMWLNQYLTRGTLPSTTNRPGNKVRGHRDYNPLQEWQNRAQRLQEEWLHRQQEKWVLEENKPQQAPAQPLGIVGKRQQDEEKRKPLDQQQQARDKMLAETAEGAKGQFASGREAAHAAAEAFGTTFMYDSDDEHRQQQQQDSPKPRPRPPIHTQPPPSDKAQSTLGSTPRSDQAGRPSPGSNAAPNSARAAHAPAQPPQQQTQQQPQQQQQKPLTPTPPSDAKRVPDRPGRPLTPSGSQPPLSPHQQQPHQQQQQPPQHTSMSLMSLAQQNTQQQQQPTRMPVPPPPRGPSQDQAPPRRATAMSQPETPEQQQQQQGQAQGTTATQQQQQQQQKRPLSTRNLAAAAALNVARESVAEQQRRPSQDRAMSTPVSLEQLASLEANKSRGSEEETPLLSVKSIGPKSQSAFKKVPSVGDILGSGQGYHGSHDTSNYSDMVTDQAQAALRAAQEQEAWLAMAQGREIVAGIPLPRRQQGQVFPEVEGLNDKRDMSLPARKQRNSQYLTMRHQQQQAAATAARAARLQRSPGFNPPQGLAVGNGTGMSRQGSAVPMTGEDGEFSASSLGMGVSMAPPSARRSLDLGIRNSRPSIPQTRTPIQPNVRTSLAMRSSISSSNPSQPPSPLSMTIGGTRFGSRAVGSSGPGSLSTSLDSSSGPSPFQIQGPQPRSPNISLSNPLNSRSAPLHQHVRSLDPGPLAAPPPPPNVIIKPSFSQELMSRRPSGGGNPPRTPEGGSGALGVRGVSARGRQSALSVSTPQLPSLATQQQQQQQ